jgi:hypothetical protein
MSTPNPFNFPVVVTTAGMQPQDPTAIRSQIQAAAVAKSPGITTDLPGILLEDILSTDTLAIALCDQARVETVNSLTPYGANEFTLGQLGTIYLGEGAPGKPTNTSVLVVFSYPTVGLVINNGLLVGDGTNVYQVQGGGVIGSGGTSLPINAIAVQSGSFGVPANTVNQIKTSVPSGLTVNNPIAGTPAGQTETWSSFRARVLQAGLVACSSSARGIKTLVGLVTGVQPNLISVRLVSGGFEVIVGGGDPYQVAYAIFSAVDNPAALQGSTTTVRNVTVSLIDPPNTYNITRVNPPQQLVTMSVTWNTVLTSFTGGAAFASLVAAPQPNGSLGPLVAYINSIPVGQPINVLEMNQIFQQAIASVLDPTLLTRLVFAVNINGVLTPPTSGTFAIPGDPESYFFTVVDGSGITVTQG